MHSTRVGNASAAIDDDMEGERPVLGRPNAVVKIIVQGRLPTRHGLARRCKRGIIEQDRLGQTRAYNIVLHDGTSLTPVDGKQSNLVAGELLANADK
jgi:hypothetical protein